MERTRCLTLSFYPVNAIDQQNSYIIYLANPIVSEQRRTHTFLCVFGSVIMLVRWTLVIRAFDMHSKSIFAFNAKKKKPQTLYSCANAYIQQFQKNILFLFMQTSKWKKKSQINLVYSFLHIINATIWRLRGEKKLDNV